jgi:aspartate-semialdehyde dehydrogenase
MRKSKKIRVILIGTDSLRGKEIKNVLEEKEFPIEKIDFYDPDVQEEYSKLTQFRGEPKVVHHLAKESVADVDLVFLAADKKVNQEFGILAPERKSWAIDLSETFNRKEDVPVVVAGVNDDIVLKDKPTLIANPHPVTVVLSHLFHTVAEEFGIFKAISFVLQPVSAFDEQGIKELANQSFSILSSASLEKKVFKEQIAFNFLPNTEAADEGGFSPDERQVLSEIRRVLKPRHFPVSLSIIQAPVFHTYSIMTYLELEKEADIQGLKNLFKKGTLFKVCLPGLSSPVSAAGKDEICIGQIKEEESFPRSFWIWTVTDNLTRGSALNALEIAEKIFAEP